MSRLSLAEDHVQGVAPETILVIDTDADLGQVIVDQLRMDGYRAMLAQSAGHARALVAQRPVRAIVLGDLESPRGALDMLAEIRHSSGESSPWDAATPVIMVSARDEELDLARAFASGADDFMSRPARYTELRARLQAILRRAYGESTPRLLCVGPLEIDTASHAVTLSGQRIELCRREYELLVHLASEPDRVFTKTELLRSVWGFQSPGATRTVDSHACRLRRKLSACGGRWVVNVWGVGYRLT
ncbi:MAG TPA: response regulator transcription factor [Solirubrobacteraceae bacterium]|jgi:DNA-binding response OmpR family regulator